MKYFTRQEAEALIPELERIFTDIGLLADRAEAKAEAAGRLEGAGQNAAEIEIGKAQIRFLAEQIEALLGQIARLGALPKGVNPPLVDFPCRLKGRDVFLCWRAGEKKISSYHGVDEGFAGRRPLPPGQSSSAG